MSGLYVSINFANSPLLMTARIPFTFQEKSFIVLLYRDDII